METKTRDQLYQEHLDSDDTPMDREEWEVTNFPSEPKRIFVDIRGGCLQGIYGDQLNTKEQIMLILRDWDNIEQGDEDPAGCDYNPEVRYW